MQLFYQGSYYAIGGKRMNFQQEKTKEDDTFILTLPAIANAMKSAGVSTAEIILGVGLSIDIYGAQKKAFGQYFLRDNIRFSLRIMTIIAESRNARYLPKVMLHYASITRS